MTSTRKKPPLVTRGEIKSSPLSYPQRRLWFLDQLQGSTPEYNVPIAFQLRGPLNFAALTHGCAAILERHEVLRTRYQMVGEEPVQMIDSSPSFELIKEDLSALNETSRGQEVAKQIQREWSEPFRLTSGPVVRMKLLRIAPKEHILLRSVHHIAFDGWSGGLFNRELKTLYEAYLQGSSFPLPPLPLQYADYAAWQRAWLEGPDLNADTNYWRKQLDGWPGPLHLPQNGRASVSRTAAKWLTIIPSPQLLALRQVSRCERVTLFMTLLAAFAVLLARYSGQDDLTIGTPIANRTETQLEPMIGLFANALPLRFRLSRSMRFRELLEQVRQTAMDAYTHQDVPLERIAEPFVQRSNGGTPLLQVVFGQQNYPSASVLQMQDMEVRRLPNADEVAARFDLEVQSSEWAGELRLSWIYSRSLFDEWRIEQLSTDYVAILNSIAEDPEQELRHIQISSAPSGPFLALDVDRPSTEFVAFIQLFRSQAQQTPSTIAVECRSEKLTYAELDERSNQLANILWAEGIEAEDVVGIHLPRGVSLIISMLGILKTGASYLPLDPDHPVLRTAEILSIARPRVVIVSEQTQSIATSIPRLCIDDLKIASQLRSNDVRITDVTIHPSSAAYVIFTSGSTGKPKGVVIEHRALTAFVSAIRSHLPYTSKDVHLAITTPSFDIAILELLVPLCGGGRVIVAHKAQVLDPHQLATVVHDQQVTSIQATPAYWSLFCADHERVLSGVRVLVGGEALPSSLAGRLHRHAATVHNLYGPTEATVWTSIHQVTDRDASSGAPSTVSIGHPLPGYKAYILDRYLEPVPRGVEGDLYIGGPGLARGYLNRPDLTAERFVANPFDAPGSRMYLSGDRARYSEDGSIEFLGRQDNQVKLRGFRIELSEIEAELKRQPCVRDAAVVLREKNGEHYLAAFVVCVGDGVLDIASLRKDLACTLPDYMVPQIFVGLAALPLNTNGKVDRTALPEIDTLPVESNHPATDLELALCQLFSEELSVSGVTPAHDFFALGGHSMAAIRLVNRIRTTLSVDVPLRVLMDGPSIAQLATSITESQGRAPRAGIL